MLSICVENVELKILSEFKLNNWYVEVKCQIEWMDVKAGLQQSKNLVTASIRYIDRKIDR